METNRSRHQQTSIKYTIVKANTPIEPGGIVFDSKGSRQRSYSKITKTKMRGPRFFLYFKKISNTMRTHFWQKQL